jgi:hypothetical protein
VVCRGARGGQPHELQDAQQQRQRAAPGEHPLLSRLPSHAHSDEPPVVVLNMTGTRIEDNPSGWAGLRVGEATSDLTRASALRSLCSREYGRSSRRGQGRQEVRLRRARLCR